MNGASDGWTRAWLVPFLLRSMRGGDLSLKQALERCRREIEPFFLLCENQPVYEVRR
jgi:hypothetical protein